MVAAGREIRAPVASQPETVHALIYGGRKRGCTAGTLVRATATTEEEGRGRADKWRSQALMHDAWC